MAENRFMREMNNEVKANEQKAIEAKAQEIKETNQKIIDETNPNTIVETVLDVKNKDYYMAKTEEGNPVDVAGNCESKIVRIGGYQCYVCGSTEKEMKEDEDYIRLALATGDTALPRFFGFIISGRYITKAISILGYPVLTVGHTEEERVEDEIKARICYAKLRKGSHMDVLTAEELIEAGLEPTKEFEKDGYRYIYFADQKCARTFDGIKVADISDIPESLGVETAIELLKSRIQTPQYEENEYDGEEEYWDDEEYDCDHEEEWMERHPHGYYNNGKDYGEYWDE